MMRYAGHIGTERGWGGGRVRNIYKERRLELQSAKSVRYKGPPKKCVPMCTTSEGMSGDFKILIGLRVLLTCC